MDKSKEFILMCEKARKLQENHVFAPGDNYSPKEPLTIFKQFAHWKCNPGTVYIIDSFTEPDPKVFNTNNLICVFRQDQLQDMVVNDYKHFYRLLDCFHQWSDEIPRNHYTSMEQLWLAYVMWSLYKKTWNGNEWVANRKVRNE